MMKDNPKKEEKKIQKADIDAASVKLSPIAGVPPRIYLPAVYGLALLVVLFLFFALPGIRRPGAMLEFSGLPSKSAVLVDGKYAGSTRNPIFVSSGSHAISIEKTGFAPQNLDLKVTGRILGSAFFPTRHKVEYRLNPGDSDLILAQAYSEYLSWSLAGKPSALYQVPSVLSEAMADFLFATRDGETSKGPSLRQFTASTLAATASPENARDGLKSAGLLATRGIANPLGFVELSRILVASLSPAKLGFAWLKDSGGIKAGLPATPLSFPDAKAESPYNPPSPSKASILLGGHRFMLFEARTITLGGQAPSGAFLPYTLALGEYGLATTEVTRAQWALFLDANPFWAPSNRSTLIEAGLAEETYLVDWTGLRDETPVVGLSWYAAQAYCQWLSKASSTYRVVLPSEAQWESAAALSPKDPALWSNRAKTGPEPVGSQGWGAFGFADLLGNVWEWTDDWYLPYPGLGQDGYPEFKGSEKSVRGGSWANAPGSVEIRSRGGLPPSHASAFLGFRPAIVRK
jgi:hypothetical protein